MALTINPAVSRVGYRRWMVHVGLFASGVAAGALLTYAVARVLYVALGELASFAWLAFALPLIVLAALHDLGIPAPVPYPPRRQVPEWLRRVLPPSLTALAYGTQLGTGFLTRFTYSTHIAFVALLATQSSPSAIGAGVLAFAISKSFVVLSSPAGLAYDEFERRLLHRYRMRGQTPLRAANAALALATAAVLITTI